MSAIPIKIKSKLFILIFSLLIISAGFFRIYNISWGEPYFFHPDERNIASSVSQLRFPEQMNPNFFAYGSLPIYSIYFIGLGINLVRQIADPAVKFEDAILIGRFFSAMYSLLLIPLMISIVHLIFKQTIKVNSISVLVVMTLGATSIGLIQYAHFATFEMWLTFFTTLLFYFCLKYYYGKKIKYLFLCGVIMGILMSTKISHAVMFPLPILLFMYTAVKKRNITFISFRSFKKLKILLILLITDFLPKFLIFSLLVFFVYLLTNPYAILDFKSFSGSMKYESGVALGSIPVFYTGEFFDSIPIIFHIEKVYPFLLNPFTSIIFLFSIFYVAYKAIWKRNFAYKLLIAFYFVLFLSNAFMYVKWARYLVPTLPFIYIICAIAIFDLYQFLQPLIVKNRKYVILKYVLVSIFICFNIFFAFSFFVTVYVNEDSRIAARDFALKNIQPDDKIISEVYDLGIVPFNNDFRNIELFNFYDLDTQNLDVDYGTIGNLPYDLEEKIDSARYIILPSQRIIGTRAKNPADFPRGFAFYSRLIRGDMGFRKIYETPCDVFCKATYLNDPIFRYEQTVNVFDRPTVYIFERINR